jgi:hypothetical protein
VGLKIRDRQSIRRQSRPQPSVMEVQIAQAWLVALPTPKALWKFPAI